MQRACWNLPPAAAMYSPTTPPSLDLPGPFPLANYGQNVKQPVYVGDVAKAIVAAAADPAAEGATYELVGPKQYTMAGICEYVGETIREPMWTVGIPNEVRVWSTALP